jgi:hypothetical protein
VDDSDSDYDPIELSEDMIDFQDFLRKSDDVEIITYMECKLSLKSTRIIILGYL